MVRAHAFQPIPAPQIPLAAPSTNGHGQPGERPASGIRSLTTVERRNSVVTLTGQVSNWVLEAAEVDFLWLRRLERRSGQDLLSAVAAK